MYYPILYITHVQEIYSTSQHSVGQYTTNYNLPITGQENPSLHERNISLWNQVQSLKKLVPLRIWNANTNYWSGCTHTRRSRSGHIFAVNGSPIFWKSKLQTAEALSSKKAKYVSLAFWVKDITVRVAWFKTFFYGRSCNEESQIPQTEIEINISGAI